MATSEQQQLIALTTMMFNAPPGAHFLAELEAQLAAGQSFADIAVGLAQTSLFNSQFDGLAIDSQKIDLVLSFVGIDESNPAYQEAFDFFQNGINSEVNPGILLAEAADFLSTTEDETFSVAATIFRNKVDVGITHSVSLGLGGTDIDALKQAVANVTASAASVTNAKEALQQLVNEQQPEQDQPGTGGTIGSPTQPATFDASVDASNVVTFSGTATGDITAKWNGDDVTFTRAGLTDNLTAQTTAVFTSAALTSVDGSGNTHGLNLTFAGAVDAKGGSGNDTFNMNGNYSSASKIDGGAGTDTLVLTSTEATEATKGQSVFHMETIRISDGLNGTVSVAHFNTNSLTLGHGLAGNSTVNYSTGTNNLNLGGFNHGANALTAAGGDSKSELNITVGDAETFKGTTNLGPVTIESTGAVNLSSVGAANTFGAFALLDTGHATLKITGEQTVTFNGAVSAGTIDASSGFKGALNLEVATATATTIMGSSQSDKLIGSDFDDTIEGGDGDDRIIGGGGSDTLTGDAGDDTFVFNGAVGSTDTGNTIVDFGIGTNLIEFTTVASTGSGIAAGDFQSAAVNNGNIIASGGFAFVTDGSGIANTANTLSTTDVASFLANVNGMGNAFLPLNPDAVLYIAVTDGTDTGVYLYKESGNEQEITAGELELIVTLQGVTSITASELSDFTTPPL